MLLLIYALISLDTDTPIQGWNSWNHFNCNITESLIQETVDALISSGLAEVGYNYINLDDCWQAPTRDEYNRLQPHPDKFPSGMKALGDYIHSKGLKFGIYSSAGFKTCQAFPASLGMEESDAAMFASWGVDYLKYDNCYTDHGSPQQRYPSMGQALQSSGKDIVYSLCEWGRENPAAWAGKSATGAHLWRTSMDISDRWLSIVKNAAVNTPLWRYAGNGILTSLTDGSSNTGGSNSMEYGWNDPDMLEVGNGGCTRVEYMSHFSLWAMMKSPMIVGNDIREVTKGDETWDILANKEVLAVNQDRNGFQARRVWSDRSPEDKDALLIATKCNSGDTSNMQQNQQGKWKDTVEDQQWWYDTADSTIRIRREGGDRCLYEVTTTNTTASATIAYPKEEEEEEEEEDDAATLDVSPLPHTVLHSVTIVNCDGSGGFQPTPWTVGASTGGAIQSKTTGRCLEVAKSDLLPIAQGKRIQTAACQVSMLVWRVGDVHVCFYIYTL